MELTFIGTGSGKTGLNRFHTALVFNSYGHKMLVDAGDGISKALLKQKIIYNEIDSILFSHYHADHFGGLTALITQMKLNERSSTLNIFTHRDLIKPIRYVLNFGYLFEDHLGFQLNIIPFDYNTKIIINETIAIEARKNTHILDKYNIGRSDIIKFHSSSFRFSIENLIVVYTSDVGSPEDLLLFNDSDIDIFIMETTHTKTEDIIRVCEKIQPKEIYLTHIEDSDEILLKKWLENLEKPSKNKVFLTFDGMKISRN